MIPRDHDSDAPHQEPETGAADWTTEESVAEPATPVDAAPRRLDPRAVVGDTPQPRPAATLPMPTPVAGPVQSPKPSEAPAPPTQAAATSTIPEPTTPRPSPWSRNDPASGVWLASESGLVPRDPEAAHPADSGAPLAATDMDFGATRVHPLPQQPPDDWGWQPGPAFEQPRGYPSVSARSVAPYADDPRLDPTIEDGERASRRRRGVPWGRLFISFVLGLILSGFVAAGAIYAYEQQYSERILPHVRVGDVDVSGLTRDAARSRLSDAFAGYGDGTVEVTLAGQTTEIPYADFDRRADIDAMVDAAFAVGRAPSPVERLLGELRTITRGASIAPSVVLDTDKLAQRVHDIARAGESTPVDAGAVVTADGFATTPSKTGQSVDEGSAAADIAGQLASVDAPQRVQISLTATVLQPAVTDTSAQLATKQAALMQNDIVLQDGTDTWVVPAATVHRWLSFTIINNRVRIAIDTKAVLAELKPLAKKIDRTTVNATVKLSGTKIVFGKPSVEGRTFNASKTTTAVVNGLRNRALGTLATDAPIPPVLALVKPTLTTAEAKAAIPLMKPISSWTTNYQASDHNGFGANIRIPTTTINGYVVAPGETFSFWKAVGPVTKELGYQDGGAIIDGHTEPQGAIGGGICSCSTTLFNAALRAGFAMGDRLNHFYYIDRYPLGLDATVFISASGAAQDMTWTNDTEYPVVIQGINARGYVRFVLYSVPNGRTTTFTDPIVKNYTKATTQTKVDKTIPRGTTKHIEYATDGQDVWVTRTVKDKAGAVLRENTYYSHYSTITGIILTNP